MNIIADFRPTLRQNEALKYLDDDETEELIFGGGAGGGKSVLGCFWVIKNCLKYPGVRYIIGRAKLKNLLQSTVKTLFRIMGNTDSPKGEVRFNLRQDRDYTYRQMSGEIHFNNSSEIIFKDFFQYPTDPEFDSLGSVEITGAFLDEISQIGTKAREITLSRMRHLTDKYHLKGKLLGCTNPCKTWAYYDFYKPWKEKKETKTKKFIQALAKDNPYLDPNYIEILKRRDKLTKERLLYGNWEYDDDPGTLVNYDKSVDIFTNEYVKKKDEQKYITADPARFGQDRAVIYVWKGLYIYKVFAYGKTSGDFIERKIIELAKSESVPRSNIILDEDGIGGPIMDNIPGIKGFINNASPIKEMTGGQEISNYSNLKSQCYFKLAEYINAGKIGAYFSNPEYKEILIEDLEQIKRKDPDKDTKMQIVPKDEMKEKLGRSPDFSDCMMFRMYFEIKKSDYFLLEDKEGTIF